LSLNKSIGLSIDGQTSTDHLSNMYSQYPSVNNNNNLLSLKSNNLNEAVHLPVSTFTDSEPNTPVASQLKSLSATNRQNIIALKEQLATENKIESEFKDR
jgi:hypothetical protein